MHVSLQGTPFAFEPALPVAAREGVSTAARAGRRRGRAKLRRDGTTDCRLAGHRPTDRSALLPDGSPPKTQQTASRAPLAPPREVASGSEAHGSVTCARDRQTCVQR